MLRLEEEEQRIRLTYARRDQEGKPALYTWSRPEVLYHQSRFRAVAASMLTAQGLSDLAGLEVLDVGCGTGGWLRTLAEWGALPERLHGLDLLPDRIERARSLAPNIDFQVASAWETPFPEASLDLVSAHTVFSSILKAEAREALAREMLRVLRPTGRIMIYDFRVSDPRNPETIGLGRAEIRRLFPGMKLFGRSLTLAPPLCRRLAPLSPLLAAVVEALFPFLRTHTMSFLTRGAGPRKSPDRPSQPRPDVA